MMEIVAASDADSGWAVKAAPMPDFPSSTVPSSVPSVASFAPSNLDMPGMTKGMLQLSGQGLGGFNNF